MVTQFGCFALAALVAALMTPPIGDDAPASLTRLSEPDLRAMFSQNLIIRPGAPAQVATVSDEFTAKGRYFQSGRGVPLTGSYVIRGDRVCVDEGRNSAEKCRAFYRSPTGALWETDPYGGASTVAVLVRVQMERTPNTLKGM